MIIFVKNKLFNDSENTECNKLQTMGKQVLLDFDIEAQLLETDDKMVEQLRNISDAIFKHSNNIGTNKNSSAILLNINLENISTTEELFTQAQTPVKTNFPVSVTLRQQLNIEKSENEDLNINSCIITGNTLVFIDFSKIRLIICNVDGTVIHYIPLFYRPFYMTQIDSNTVAVSCIFDRMILIINISTRSVTSTINTSGNCWGISYNDNNLYVVIGMSIIHVMDLTGKVIRTIPTPSDYINDITVKIDRLVCTDKRIIYCCSLDGKLNWMFDKYTFQDLTCVQIDYEGNVYVTDWRTNTVVVVSEDGQQHRELLTKSDGLDEPWGINLDKEENILFVCNRCNRQAFLFDVKRKPTE